MEEEDGCFATEFDEDGGCLTGETGFAGGSGCANLLFSKHDVM